MGHGSKGAVVGENVPVRCPACRRAHVYASPVYPCACGAPVAPPLVRGAPAVPITHRTWSDEWVTVRCAGCGRQDQWPQPELGCPCGVVLRIPVRPVAAAPQPSGGPAPSGGTTASTTGVSTVRAPAHIPPPPATAAPRPSFRPVTIRTARDAVTAAALYLRWLGFRDVVQPEEHSPSGIDLRGPGLVAQVDPTTRPASLRAVECLWLNGLAASSTSVFFTLAGYEEKARARADGLLVPLFVMDLTGTPQPVNGPADELVARGV
ncbi:hypothetical protein [Streptomyces sp. SP18CS02]|uniref:hypothetical protein n=1 Tax=Streptomyces sp. SP18CS02 TaxID=3002531 RepID=UPI002E79E3BE|nr:hypothetical protein [Streptomyces sp. SP18CS02]MEE1753814.1 hypothetical protein [Streptomyces sp. SP18CS02]